MRFREVRLSAPRNLVFFLLMTGGLFLTGCAGTQTGVSSGARSNYQKIAVVPEVNDRLLSVYWATPFSEPQVSEARMGWPANDGVGQISREILGRSGASVTVTGSPTTSVAKASDAVVVLQQTPLDQFAQRYDPGKDLLLSAVSVAGAARAGGLAIIVIDNKKRYEPRSVLRISASGSGGKSGDTFCAVGIIPSLVDPRTGATIRKGRALMGLEKLPGTLSGKGWNTLTQKERSTVLLYCQSALRRAVSQSFVELDIVG